jgi:hypothetical protein
MKKIIIPFALSLCLLSCSSDPRKQLISDHEQIIDGTKTDLSLKIISLKDLGSVSAKDSLKILEPDFVKQRDQKIQTLNSSIQSFQELLVSDIEKSKHEEFQEIRENHLESAKFWEDQINEMKESIESYKNDCKDTFLETMYKRISDYKSDTNKILLNKVQATYSIKNPFLNNVKQELTKIYMFTPNNDSIIGVIEK